MLIYIFFFFNDTATTEIYTLSLHDALPIWTHLDDERLVIRRDHWVPHLQSVELLWILHRQRQRAALRPHEGHGALVLVDRFDGAMHRHRRDLTHSRLDAGRLRRRDRRRRPRHCPEREGDSDGQRHDRRGYSKNVLHHDALLERTGVHRSGRTLGGRSTVDDGTLGVRRRTLGPWSLQRSMTSLS